MCIEWGSTGARAFSSGENLWIVPETRKYYGVPKIRTQCCHRRTCGSTFLLPGSKFKFVISETRTRQPTFWPNPHLPPRECVINKICLMGLDGRGSGVAKLICLQEGVRSTSARSPSEVASLPRVSLRGFFV